MDDRFRSENTSFNNKPKFSSPPNITKSNSLGDFSENINSIQGQKASAPNTNTVSKAKKFEVHLPDDVESFPDFSSSSQVNREPVLKDVTGKEYLSSIQDNPRTLSAASQSVAKPPVQRTSPTGRPATTKNSAVPQVRRQAPKGAGNRNVPTRVTKTPPARTTAQSAAQKSVQHQKSKEKAKKRYNFINSVLVACVCIIFISILTVTASTVAMSTINDILVIDKTNGDYVSVVIPEGAEYEQVFEILKDAGLVKQPLVTDIFCKFRHYDQVNKRDENGNLVTVKIAYEPGIYYLDADMGVESMLETMMVSSSKSKDTVRLTFPEGWTIAQIFEKIEKYEVCEAEKLYANLEIIGQQYDIISTLAPVSGRYLKAEGYLFPDTYDFYIGENASSVIKKLFNNFENKWKNEYDDRIKELGLTIDEVVTIASVIQREAKDTTQMDVISSVIHNRLNDRATYPSIDMNSTKDYILSLKDYKLFSDFYYNLYLNSYNTYSNPGLPPGPICNPGAAAIRAALYPADTDYCFFCHDENGNIYLAATASEHQANTEKVLYGTNGVNND